MSTVNWMDTTVKPAETSNASNQAVSGTTGQLPNQSPKQSSRRVLDLYPESAVLGLDLESFRWQESTFAMLNLALLAALLCGHALFSEHFGTPTPALVGLLSVGFLLQLGELIWMQTRIEPLNGGALRTLTTISIVWDVALALVLGVLTDRIDSPYYVLMLVPVLLASFRRSLLETLLVVVAASLSQFYVVWNFYQHHSPVELDEYFEAGTASLIFLLTGVLVWFLVNHLRRKEIWVGRELARTYEDTGTAVARGEAGCRGPVVGWHCA